MKKSLPPFIMYVILMLADGLLTLYNTPDLSMEANPLVLYLHLGWGTLITVNLIFFVIMFFACRYSFEKYQTIIADVPDFKSYISQVFYNRPDKFVWSLYKLPKNWKPFWAMLGYSCAYSLSAAAVVRIFEWLAVTFSLDMTSYDNFRYNYCFGRFDLVVVLIVSTILMLVWIRKEYEKSCRILSCNKTEKENVK